MLVELLEKGTSGLSLVGPIFKDAEEHGEEALFIEVCRSGGVIGEVIGKPDLALIGRIECDHSRGEYEGAIDVKESLKANEGFLEEVEHLEEREIVQIG